MIITFMLMYYRPESVSSFYLFDDLIEKCLDEHHEVLVITGNPVRGIDAKTRHDYRRLKNLRNETIGSLHIHRINAWFDTQSGGIKRAFRYLSLVIGCSLKLLFAKSDVVYMQSDPPVIYAFLLSIVCRMKRIPLIYHIQDLAPDNLYQNLPPKRPLSYRILNRIHRFSMRKCVKIIAISEDIKRMIHEKEIALEKIEVVHNWSYRSFGVKVNLPAEYDFLREIHPFIVLYGGNIGHVQNMEVILKAAERLKTENILILIVGDGIMRSALETQIKTSDLTNVVLFPKLDMELSEALYHFPDVNLITLNSGIIYTAFPSKTSSCLKAGKPIIACVDLDSELSMLIKNNNLGICVDTNDYVGLSEAILEIRNDPSSYVKADFDRIYDNLFDRNRNIDRIYQYLIDSKK